MTHQVPVVAIVYTTIPQDKAVDFGTKAVEIRLAACVNMMQGESVYYWDNQLCHEAECMVVMKTAPHKLEALKQWVSHNHPYQSPAIVTWLARSSMDYAAYVWQTVGDDLCDRASHVEESIANESNDGNNASRHHVNKEEPQP